MSFIEDYTPPLDFASCANALVIFKVGCESAIGCQYYKTRGVRPNELIGLVERKRENYQCHI